MEGEGFVLVETPAEVFEEEAAPPEPQRNHFERAMSASGSPC
jgi:hypothetical protein